MVLRNLILGIWCLSSALGCATRSSSDSSEAPQLRPGWSSQDADSAADVRLKPKSGRNQDESIDQPLNIDYVRLQASLGLDRAFDKLGYIEKSFPTCEAGFGYPSSSNCRRDTFVLIHFRLLCRESEGTISTPLNESDLIPLGRSAVQWNLGPAKGDLVLDSQGYGQIRTTLNKSAKTQRLRMTVGNDFLFLNAGEVNRVVAPGNWCP